MNKIPTCDMCHREVKNETLVVCADSDDIMRPAFNLGEKKVPPFYSVCEGCSKKMNEVMRAYKRKEIEGTWRDPNVL